MSCPNYREMSKLLLRNVKRQKFCDNIVLLKQNTKKKLKRFEFTKKKKKKAKYKKKKI